MLNGALLMDEMMIFLCGVYSIGFAVFHTQFWRLFKWKEELNKLQPVNKAIMQILNLRMIYFFLFVGITCFFFPKLLLNTSFGTFFLSAMSLFCFGRTIEQFIFIRIDHPMVHFLTYLFIIGSLLFAIPIFL